MVFFEVVWNIFFLVNTCWRPFRPLHNFHAAMLLNVFDQWVGRISSRMPFGKSCVVIKYRIGLLVPIHALQLLLRSNCKKTVYLVFHVSKPLCFDSAKRRCWEKSFKEVKWFVSYDRRLWPPANFCDVKEMGEVLLGHSVWHMKLLMKIRDCNHIFCSLIICFFKYARLTGKWSDRNLHG